MYTYKIHISNTANNNYTSLGYANCIASVQLYEPNNKSS